MDSDTTTEMIVPANVSWPYLSRKNFTRALPIANGNQISIGSWNLLNGISYFEIFTQVNSTGFTCSKTYRFSVTNNATNNVWQRVVPEIDSGPSGSNDYDLWINSDGSTVSFKINRFSGSSAGEIKIFINKYGSLDDVFTSSTATTGLSSSSDYPSSFGLNSVSLNSANTYEGDQTINSKLTVIGDGVNFPSVRFGAGLSGLSSNSSVDGSLILQGSSAGAKSQFEIISPSGNQRIIMEADSVNGPLLYSQGGNLKFNSASASQVYYGTNSSQGVLFSSSVNASPDLGLTRNSSGILRVTNGSSSLASISAQNLRLNSVDSSKTQALYALGDYVYIENSGNKPVGFICNHTSGVAAAFAAGANNSAIIYDSTGSFGIASQGNSLIKNSPATGALNYRMWLNSNGDIGINTTSPLAKLDVNGNVNATAFFGNGQNLTNLNSANLLGTVPAASLPNPGINTLGGVKRNEGTAGQYVSGLSIDGFLMYGNLEERQLTTIDVLSPKDFETPLSGTSATLSSVFGRPVLNFAHDAESSAVWTSLVPFESSLDNGASFNFWWSCQTTVGNVGWQLFLERVNEGSSISSDRFFGPFTVGISNVPSSGSIKKSILNLTTGDLAGISKGEIFRAKISRDINADSAAAIASLHRVEIRTLAIQPII